QVAIAAVKALSSRDLVGVISYGWNTGSGVWDHPLGPAGDKSAVISAIKKMQMGDMPDFHQPMQAAYTKLVACDAVQKHVIMISDGDPSSPTSALLSKFKQAGITVTGVAVFPHSPSDVMSLKRIAQATGGRFYHVTNPNSLPQIFIKEAQTVKRSLIVEKEFRPDVTSGLSEIVRGLGGALPQLDGYVLTDEMGGVSDLIVTGPEKDPILASRQVGVGRTVAFTSTADSRWAGAWSGWGGYGRFWEQTVRWAAKSSQSPECEVFADVEGRTVTVTVEAQDAKGEFVQFSEITGRAIGPDMEPKDITLSQVGPGQYRAKFTAGQSGSYLVNFRYRKAGEADRLGMAQSVVTVPYAPEYSDLTDNFALLSQIAKETGGRILTARADEAELFTRAGLTFPETPLPTTKPLVILWLVLFILDVAVRRVAVDVRAIGRKLKEWVRRPFGLRPGEDKKYMEALIKRKKGVHDKLTQQEEAKVRSRRFTAAPDAKTDLPDQEYLAPIRPASKAGDTETKAAKGQAEESNLDRLLKAKRRAGRDRGKDETNESS
ncbi:MAG: VWA domain-containing protein, partial [Planctomycetes bacterium]|nr:VWA domain-containing protein [Planctomycetota bacterium]